MHNICIMAEAVRLIAVRAGQRAKELGFTQAQISDHLGIHQSQVSRILSGQIMRRSRNFDAICQFLELQSVGVSAATVRKNPELIDALVSVWDGTEIHAAALAAVIRSLGALAGATAIARTGAHKE